jgi:hypothetical protein
MCLLVLNMFLTFHENVVLDLIWRMRTTHTLIDIIALTENIVRVDSLRILKLHLVVLKLINLMLGHLTETSLIQLIIV